MIDFVESPIRLLWIPPALVLGLGLYWLALMRREKWLKTIGKAETLARLFPPDILKQRKIKVSLELTALVLAIFAYAGPRWGVELVTQESRGVNVVVAVDTSLSMLAEDIGEPRIDKARRELALVLEGLSGHRVGVIAFAGAAHVQCPLTTDIEAAKSLLGAVTVGMVPQPGTDLGAAMELAEKMLARYAGQKALILLTDGEDTVGIPSQALKRLAAAAIQTNIIGIGTPEGGPIPLRDPQGKVMDYKKGPDGQTVVTKLGENSLMSIAAQASGAYYRWSAAEDEAAAIVRHVLELEASPISGGGRNRYKNRYQLPLLLAFLLLLLELLWPETRRAAAPRGAFRSVVPAAAVLLLLSGCGPTELWRGNREYGSGEYLNALDRYAKAAASSPQDPKPVFNSGDAYYKLGQLKEAEEAFSTLADPSSGSPIAPKAFYNRGNTRFKKNQYKEAVEDYKQCLLLDPKDEDCRLNLLAALHVMKNPPPPPQKPKPDENKSGGGEKPPQGSQRPQALSQEDAERILRAVKDKEKARQKAQPTQKGKPGEAKGGKDW